MRKIVVMFEAAILAAAFLSGACVQDILSPTPQTTVPVITITAQPQDVTVTQGCIESILTITASVTREASLSYQWYYSESGATGNGEAIPGENNAVFVIPFDLEYGTYYYFCEVSATDKAVSVYSNMVAVIVEEPSSDPIITITAQPENLTVTEGEISASDTLTVAAEVTEWVELAYQWFSNTAHNNEGGTAIEGESTSVFRIPDGLTEGTYYYFCEVSAPGGAEPVRSNAAVVTVSAYDSVITITKQPESFTVTEGHTSGTLTIEAEARGGAEFVYQWYYCTYSYPAGFSEWEAINGATEATYNIPDTLTEGEHWYCCGVAIPGTDIYSTSDNAWVKVNPPPLITIQTNFSNVTVIEGAISHTWTVDASVTGDAVLSYQWFSAVSDTDTAGTPIDGAESASFTLPSDLTQGKYYYFCEVSATKYALPVKTRIATVTVSGIDIAIIIQLGSLDDPVLVEQTAIAAADTDKSFTVTGTDYLNYKWYINGESSGEGETFIFNMPLGVYELAVVVTDSGGRKYSGSCHVTVR